MKFVYLLMKRKYERLHLKVKPANSDKACMAGERRGNSPRRKYFRCYTRVGETITLESNPVKLNSTLSATLLTTEGSHVFNPP